MHYLPNHRRGSALITATVILVLLASIATVLSERTVSSLQEEGRRTDDLRLAMAAESACNVGLDYLQNHSDLLGLEMTTAEKLTQLPDMDDVDDKTAKSNITNLLDDDVLNGMRITARWCYLGQRQVVRTTDSGVPRLEVVTTTPVPAGAVVQDVYFLRSTATFGSAADPNTWRTRRVEVLFVPYPQNVFVRAMFARRGYDFTGNALTDSWDSGGTGASYASSTHNANGDLGSEGDIEVKGSGDVQGDIDDFINFPLPPIPYDTAGTVDLGKLTTSIALADNSYHATYINLDHDDIVTISGLVTIYVDGPVNMVTANNKMGSIFVYDTAKPSRLTIIQNDYVDSDPLLDGVTADVDFNGKDQIGDIDDPGKLLYISAYSGEVKINGGADIGAVFYMPNATVQMNGNAAFYGSVIADGFSAKSGGAGKVNGTFDFHYDEQLSKMKLPLPPRIGVVGWYTSNPKWGDG